MRPPPPEVAAEPLVLVVIVVAVVTVLVAGLDSQQEEAFFADKEWTDIVGEEREGTEYSIVYPTLKRNLHVQTLSLNSTLLNPNFSIDLIPSLPLLSSNFLFLEAFENTSKAIPHDRTDYDCFFRSERSALDICDGIIRGLLHSTSTHYFIIQPINKSIKSKFKTEYSKPHIIFKRPIRNLNGNATRTRRIQKNDEKNLMKLNTNKRYKREGIYIQSAVFVETAVFVDRDLFEHMKTNFPIDTEREVIRFVLAMVNAVQLLYHDSSLGRPVNFLLKRLEILKDEAAGLTRSPDIDRYLSNFCNWQRTKNPAGDREPKHWDHAVILTGLDLYVRGKHGKVSSQVVGLAPVAGMCTLTSSCTVNEGRHFESVYVVAHEIGHNLGMRHDGPLAANACDPAGHIMSPTLGGGKTTWSACSRRYLERFLGTAQSRCLLDRGAAAGGRLDHGADGALPGQRFDADRQCALKYGAGSRHSSGQPLDDVCRDLHCERERYTWTSHPALEGTACGRNMWCRGGKCVAKNLASNAAYTASKPAQLRKDVDGGWGEWKTYSECASGCLFGEEGRLRAGSTGIAVETRTCNNPRPQGNGANCVGHDKKYQTCNAKQCLNVPKLTVKEYSEQICTRAKEVDSDLTGTGVQKIGNDPSESCTIWCQRRDLSTKSRGWTYPDGTACQTKRNRHGRPSYCIGGRCEEFACAAAPQHEEPRFALRPDLCPADRDDNDVADEAEAQAQAATSRRTGLRRREGEAAWAGASGCHYNCVAPGAGVRLVVRRAKGAAAAKSSVQLCEGDQKGCTHVKSSFQHASMVCTKYKEKVRRLSGLGIQISPIIEDPDRPCRVACQDDTIQHRFYLVNGEDGWFPFGTDCSKGVPSKRAYCINGKCLEFGPDDTPLSQSEFTLPLLSRVTRSLHTNGTKVTATLHPEALEEIVWKLNQTLSGKVSPIEISEFSIDLNNPVHVNMEMESEKTTLRNDYKTSHEDYYNYT